MWFQNYFKSLTSTLSRRHSIRRRPPSSRLCVEALEDRLALSFTVSDNNIDVDAYAPTALAADFNNDLVQDLALANNSTVSVLLGAGDGTFGPARSSAIGSSLPGRTRELAAGDFNGDGNLDLAVAVSDGNLVEYPKLLLGNGDGTFQSPQLVGLEIPPAPVGPSLYDFSTTNVAVADANADGRPDLLFTGEVWYQTDNGEEFFAYGYTGVSLGRGDGVFSSTFGDLVGGADFAAADLNGDGKVDMVSANGARFGQGDGTFGAWQGFAGPEGVRVALADFNGDGTLDVAATGGGTNPSGGFVRLGNGDGTVQPAQSYASGPNPIQLATVDFNGDGKTDLVTANNGDSTVTVCLGNGNGTFQAPLLFQSSPSGGNPFNMAVADFNGDGRPDVAVSADPHNLRVLLNDGIWTAVDISDVTVSEGNTGTRNATFTVTLSAASAQPVTVAYTTAGGTAAVGDYQDTSGTLTFAPGETSKAITVLVNGDRLAEPTETFVVNLSGSTNATIADGQGVATILDDEPRISIGDVTKKEGNAKKSALFVFTVTLSVAYDQPVTMSFGTVNGTATTSDGDYVGKTGTLTFAPGETSKTITIEVKGDSKKESDETFYLDLFGLSSNALFTKNRGIGKILNDD